jgi:2-methylcitrate dehydratase PrpD
MGEGQALANVLAEFASDLQFEAVPSNVRLQAINALVNWMGCVLGGCREDVSRVAAASITVPGRAMLIGHRKKSDLAGAAFVNSVSASALSFDDTHLASVAHPTGPVASAILAAAQSGEVIDGNQFLDALIVGIEISCRLANALVVPPATPRLGFYMQGVVGPVGVAGALGRVLNLDRQRISSAMGLASAMSGGTRATHGSMAGLMVPAFGARAGVQAVNLAQAGAICSDGALDETRGFLEVFSDRADPAHATNALGERYEMLNVSFKPYPAGIVLHPAVEACLEICRSIPADDAIVSVHVFAHPHAYALTNRPWPETALEAQISLQHWAAVALATGKADAWALGEAALSDSRIAALRGMVELLADDGVPQDGARVAVTLSSGQTHRSSIDAARGSARRPLVEGELDSKFLCQASPILGRARAQVLLEALRGIEASPNVALSLDQGLAGL